MGIRVTKSIGYGLVYTDEINEDAASDFMEKWYEKEEEFWKEFKDFVAIHHGCIKFENIHDIINDTGLRMLSLGDKPNGCSPFELKHLFDNDREDKNNKVAIFQLEHRHDDLMDYYESGDGHDHIHYMNVNVYPESTRYHHHITKKNMDADLVGHLKTCAKHTALDNADELTTRFFGEEHALYTYESFEDNVRITPPLIIKYFALFSGILKNPDDWYKFKPMIYTRWR